MKISWQPFTMPTWTRYEKVDSSNNASSAYASLTCSCCCLIQSGSLNLEEVRQLMHRMDPKFPMSEIEHLMNFVDVDEDGQVNLEEFKRIFRQFEDEKDE